MSKRKEAITGKYTTVKSASKAAAHALKKGSGTSSSAATGRLAAVSFRFTIPSRTPHSYSKPQAIQSKQMTVQERVQQKLAEYTQRGVILPETRLQSVVLDGIPYLDVYAYMPKSLFKEREQRHTLHETLENLGDQTLHVIAHIYRR